MTARAVHANVHALVFLIGVLVVLYLIWHVFQFVAGADDEHFINVPQITACKQLQARMANTVPAEVICTGHPELCLNGRVNLPPGKSNEDVLTLDELACDSRTSVCTYDLTTHDNTVNCRMMINGQEVRLERRCDAFKIAEVTDGGVRFVFASAVWDLLTHRGMFIKSMSGKTYSLLYDEGMLRPDNQQKFHVLDGQRKYFGTSPPSELSGVYGSSLVSFRLAENNPNDNNTKLQEEFGIKQKQQGKQTVDMQMITYYLINNARNIASFGAQQNVTLTQHLTLAQGWSSMSYPAVTLWFDMLYDNRNAVSISEVDVLALAPTSTSTSASFADSPAGYTSPTNVDSATVCPVLLRVYVPDYKVQTQTYALDHDKYYCVSADSGCDRKMNATFFLKFAVRTYVCIVLTDSGMRIATHDAEDSQCFYSSRNCTASTFSSVKDVDLKIAAQNYVHVGQVSAAWGDGRCDPMVVA